MSELVERFALWLVGCWIIRIVVSALNLLIVVWVVEIIFGRKLSELVPPPRYLWLIVQGFARSIRWLVRALWWLIEGRPTGSDHE